MLSCLDLSSRLHQDAFELHSGYQYHFADMILAASRDKVQIILRRDDGVLLAVLCCKVSTGHRHLRECDSAVNVELKV